eukprot:scaffold92638_cov23-Cyclotella_meneghiniana.AAC.1
MYLLQCPLTQHAMYCISFSISTPGKSTTMGHLMFELGTFDQRKMDDLQSIADKKDKTCSAFAFYMD